jgi:plastocyanin
MRSARGGAFALAAVLAASAFAFAACGPKPVRTGEVVITIKGERGERSYSPASVRVALGTVVTWINGDSQPHTATAIGAFDSGPIPPNGGRWSWVAAIPGTFSYHSLIQPDMTGTLIVEVQPPANP